MRPAAKIPPIETIPVDFLTVGCSGIPYGMTPWKFLKGRKALAMATMDEDDGMPLLEIGPRERMDLAEWCCDNPHSSLARPIEQWMGRGDLPLMGMRVRVRDIRPLRDGGDSLCSLQRQWVCGDSLQQRQMSLFHFS